MNASVELVVFDLGGVLVRIVRSWEEAHAEAGLEPRPASDSKRFRAERRRLGAAFQIGQIEPEAFCRGVADASDGGYAPEDVERLLHAWQSTEYPNVDGVVDALHGAGVETAALSNTNALHWSLLRPESGTPLFPTVARLRRAYASHIMGVAKPDAAIYSAFEEATGVNGDRLLFFDDLEANVEAARARGWRAEVIDHAGDTASQLRGHLERYGVMRG
jgi:FMN phosphatase YigB (HAD superfamily)